MRVTILRYEGEHDFKVGGGALGKPPRINPEFACKWAYHLVDFMVVEPMIFNMILIMYMIMILKVIIIMYMIMILRVIMITNMIMILKLVLRMILIMILTMILIMILIMSFH